MASKGVEGWVIVEYSMDEKGRVFDAKMVDEDPPGLLTKVAVDSAKRAIYRPKYVDGQPVKVIGQLQKITIQKKKDIPVEKINCNNSARDNTVCREL